MAAAGPAALALSPEQPALDNEDSNVSSPLSDVEDGDDDDGSLDGMNMGVTPLKEELMDPSDSDSNLSEAEDTEAETERLYDTPQAQRRRDVVIGQYNDGDAIERTPSKLKKTLTLEDDGEDADNDSLSGDDDVSMPSDHEDDDPTSPIKISKQPSMPSLADAVDLADSRKRKRSLAAEHSDLEQPLRKRTGSLAPSERPEGPESALVTDLDEQDRNEEMLSTHSNSGIVSGVEDRIIKSAKVKIEPSRQSASPVKDSRVSKKVTRNGHRSRLADGEDSGDHDADTHEEGTVDEDAEQHGGTEQADLEAEDDADAAARNAEELERKQAALEEWSELEAKFGLFRERLYKDRLERLEAEEQSLQADHPSHPEYLLMKQCLDDRLEKRRAEVNTEHDLALEALDRLAIARRAQVWGQFYQGVREKREKFLEALNREWYETQNARRSAHSVPDYGLPFPANPAQRMRNAVAYNREVSYLAGLAKHEGFPAVPAMRGASAAEVEDDFEAFKRNSRTRQQSIMQPLEDYQAVAFGGTLGPAGEQFIKNTPWANPNHISHKLQSAPMQPEARTNYATPASKKSQAGSSRPNGQVAQQQSPTIQDASPETLRTATALTQGVMNMKRTGSLGGSRRASKATQEAAPKHDTAMAVS